jgi:hypothetical protein
MGVVAEAMFSFAQTVLRPKNPTYNTIHHSLMKFTWILDGCIGALDGTHILVRVCVEAHEDIRNRKGWTRFKVLAVLNMDGDSHMLVRGWQGLLMTWSC